MPIYRNRAFWTAAILIYSVLITPLSFVIIRSGVSVVDAILNAIPFGVFLALIYIFVDRTVLAAMQTDFFHRDTLRWKQGRKPAFVILLVSLMWGLPASNLGDNQSILLAVSTFLAVATVFLILGYSTASLIVSSVRTQDKTMKRFIKLLGLALGLFLVQIATSGDLGNSFLFVALISDFANVGGAYVLYRVAVSLSPLRRIVEENST